MVIPNCSRCGGTGSFYMSGDLHKSGGIVPCDCERWTRMNTSTPYVPKKPVPQWLKEFRSDVYGNST